MHHETRYALVNWERLAVARTVLLVLTGFLLIAAGVFASPWPWAGWIVAGLLLVALAYLTDSGQVRR